MTSVGKTSQKVTLADVAKLAGVGTATVDRVINERANVSGEVRKRVIEAARELGLRRILPSPHHRTLRVNVILARPDRPLIARMANEFHRQAQRLDYAVTVHRTLLKHDSPEAIAQAMKLGGFDAVVVDPLDHPLVRTAMSDLAALNRTVVTIISDVPGAARLAYVGIDHYKAGRTAGFFMSQMLPKDRPGKVIVLCHHMHLRAHAERISGLADQLKAEAPHLQVTVTVRGGDDPILSEQVLKGSFRLHKDLVGIYNVGAGNRGVVAAIRAGILDRQPLFIGHELTPFTWSSLRDGSMTLTIDQSPELQVQQALDVLMGHFGFVESLQLPVLRASNVPFVVYSPQNLPDRPPA